MNTATCANARTSSFAPFSVHSFCISYFQPIPTSPNFSVMASYRHCGFISVFPFKFPAVICLKAVAGGWLNDLYISIAVILSPQSQGFCIRIHLSRRFFCIPLRFLRCIHVLSILRESIHRGIQKQFFSLLFLLNCRSTRSRCSAAGCRCRNFRRAAGRFPRRL